MPFRRVVPQNVRKENDSPPRDRLVKEETPLGCVLQIVEMPLDRKPFQLADVEPARRDIVDVLRDRL